MDGIDAINFSIEKSRSLVERLFAFELINPIHPKQPGSKTNKKSALGKRSLVGGWT